MITTNIINRSLLTEESGKILRESGGEILAFASDSLSIPLDILQHIINYPIVTPLYRISVLHEDESVDYVIPSEDIISDGISYNENYTNGQRREISLKLVNVLTQKPTNVRWETLSDAERNLWSSDDEYYRKNIITHMKYAPSIDGLWYGKKIRYDMGFLWNGSPFYLERGTYIIDGFDMVHGIDQKNITYKLRDKFCRYSGTTGTLEVGYEIPVGTPIEEVIGGLQNLSSVDCTVNDLKPYIIDSSLAGFVTQATIRVDAGGKISDIYEQLATQMSAEYYYNTTGSLCFYPINESLNDIDKPIIWRYAEKDIQRLNFKSEEEIINVVKVIGDNVDGKIYSAVIKNDNLNSPINVYYIKERFAPPISNANIWSDEMATDLAKYELRKKTIIPLKQNIEVPYNPMLLVNNLIEIYNQDLNITNQRFLINAVSHTSNNATMSLEIINIDELPIVGQVTL